MIAVRVSRRAVYQGRPVLVAASLADLRGPTTGVVELPLRLYWSAPDRTFSLDDPAERRKVYTIVVREARHSDDLAAFLDGDTLIALWPDIFLPKPVRRAWEDEHPDLRPAQPLTGSNRRLACCPHHHGPGPQPAVGRPRLDESG